MLWYNDRHTGVAYMVQTLEHLALRRIYDHNTARVLGMQTRNERLLSTRYYPSGNSLHKYVRDICHHGGEHISDPKLLEYGFPGGIWETTQDSERVHVSRYG
jgi:hypothetical protein